MKYDLTNNERIVIKTLINDYHSKLIYNLNRVDLPRDEYYKSLKNEIVTVEKLLKKL